MKAGSALLFALLGLASLTSCGGGGMSANDAMVDPMNEVDANLVEGVYCPVVEERVTRQNCEDLTRADAEVRPGAAAFNVPDPMRRGDTVAVHLVIDRRAPRIIRVIERNTPSAPDPSEGSGLGSANGSAGAEGTPPGNEAAPAGDEPAPTPGQVVEGLEGTAQRFYPPVGRHMRAELTGRGLDVAARSEASQELPLGGQATWIWHVTAREGGAQSLTLVTLVEGVANGRRFVLARTARVRTVTVEVSLRDRVWDIVSGAPAWIKALTAMLVAFGGLLTAWYRLPWRRREAAEDESEARQPEGAEGSGGAGEG